MSPDGGVFNSSASLVGDCWRATAFVLNREQHELFSSDQFAAVAAAQWASDSRREKVPEEST
jgi:hypothetical protein